MKPELFYSATRARRPRLVALNDADEMFVQLDNGNLSDVGDTEDEEDDDFILKRLASGLSVQEVSSLLDFIPRTVTTLVIHVGTNDIAALPAGVVFQRYKDMLRKITELRPEIKKILATLILPRAPDRRRACRNRRFVMRFNKEAGRFQQPASKTLFSEGKTIFPRPRPGVVTAWPFSGSRRHPPEF
ncbi:hypothetical protein HPB50_027776 [Hyalomma asiaticum]|nr:hypothetical protein HPB50_027776 [Hyalomma asiaticum]